MTASQHLQGVPSSAILALHAIRREDKRRFKMCKYCDYENATRPWFKAINETEPAYDGIQVDEDGTPSLYLFGQDDYGWDQTKTPIRYCPFCGRKLN